MSRGIDKPQLLEKKLLVPLNEKQGPLKAVQSITLSTLSDVIYWH